MDVLKPYFVDGTRTKHLRIRHLKGMLGAEGVVRHVRQAERSDTVPDLVVAPILVARDQRVVRRKLKIEALAHLSACVRIGKRAGELRDLKRGGIHNRRVHHGKIVEIPSLDVGEKGNPLAQRSPEISLVVLRIVARRCCTTRERVSRVEGRGIAHDHDLSVQSVRSRLGQDFYAAVPQFVVFRRERILIDANLANRGFRRKLPCGESINIDLSPVRPCRRPRQRL